MLHKERKRFAEVILHLKRLTTSTATQGMKRVLANSACNNNLMLIIYVVDACKQEFAANLKWKF